MSEGERIFAEVCGAVNPQRAVETLGNGDLAVLVEELRGKRWVASWIAAWTLSVAIETAVSRFLGGVMMEEIKQTNSDEQ